MQRRAAVNQRASGAISHVLTDDWSLGRHATWIVFLFVLAGITAWSCWPTIMKLAAAWGSDKDYSAGQLVPLVALVFLYRQRRVLRKCRLTPSFGKGAALLAAGESMRIFGLLYGARPSIEHYSLVLTLGGLVLLVAGWQIFRKVLWILLFLFLMVPLPTRVHNLIASPLQSMATTGSAFLLEAFMQVTRQGNTMVLNGSTPVGVAEACSGLRMLTAFIIVAAFIAYMIKRPRWQKAVLLASSIPVAIACNIIRIVATAGVMLLVSAEAADTFFHDFAGVVMMPAAVLLMFGELWLMDRITIPETETQTVHARRGRRQCESA